MIEGKENSAFKVREFSILRYNLYLSSPKLVFNTVPSNLLCTFPQVFLAVVNAVVVNDGNKFAP